MISRRSSMKQLTIRGFDEDLRRKLEGIARSEGISLNRAALRLLRRGAGLGGAGSAKDVVGDELDYLIGSWTEEQERKFLEALEDLRGVDEGFWK